MEPLGRLVIDALINDRVAKKDFPFAPRFNINFGKINFKEIFLNSGVLKII